MCIGPHHVRVSSISNPPSKAITQQAHWPLFVAKPKRNLLAPSIIKDAPSAVADGLVVSKCTVKAPASNLLGFLPGYLAVAWISYTVRHNGTIISAAIKQATTRPLKGGASLLFLGQDEKVWEMISPSAVLGIKRVRCLI